MDKQERFKTKPLNHQLTCLNKFGGRPFYALNSEQGTGKTWIIINDIAGMWADHGLDAVLVFAPNGVHHNWTIIELPAHMPEWVRYRSVAWVSGPSKKEAAAIKSIVEGNDTTELRILTMNWEALQTKAGYEFAKKFCSSCRRLMIVGDESHKIKNPAAQRTKALMRLKPHSTYRRTMSGTPATEGPFGVFAQYSFLDENILGTTSYFAFKAEYAEMLPQDHGLIKHIVKNKTKMSPAERHETLDAANRVLSILLKNGREELVALGEKMFNLVEEGDYDEVPAVNEAMREMFSPTPNPAKTRCLQMMSKVDDMIAANLRKAAAYTNPMRTPQIVNKDKAGMPMYRNLDKLQKIIEPHTFRVTKAECLDLPPKVYKNVWFDLTKEQQAVYDEVKEECRITFEGDTTVVNRLAAISKLAQISSGFYIHPETHQVVQIKGETPKLDLFRERLESAVENGQSVIVWARFIEEIRQLKKVCDELGIEAGMLYGDIKRKDRLEAVRAFEAKEIPVFISQQQAGGTGITLVQASEVMYYSNTYSLDDRLQSEDRAHRIGQTKSVLYANFMARNTIDVAIATALQNKKRISDILTGDEAKKIVVAFLS